MVKIVLVCIAVLAVSQAAPQQQYEQPEQQPQPQTPHDQQAVHILKQDSVVTVDGYHFEFETSDGTAREEHGEIKDPGTDHETLSVKGSYRYIAPDGQHYSITFIADERGFQPTSHLDANGAQEYNSQSPGSQASGSQTFGYQPEDPSQATSSQTPADYQRESQNSPQTF